MVLIWHKNVIIIKNIFLFKKKKTLFFNENSHYTILYLYTYIIIITI